MSHADESSSNRLLRIYDRTLENSTLARIVASCVIKNMLPFSLKERLKNATRRFDDRRLGRRLHVDRTVTCIRNSSEVDSVHLINISSGGLYVETDKPAGVGQELSFDLSGRNIGPFMRVMGKVMRNTERGMAVQFI